MSEVDKRLKLDEEVFSYQTNKDNSKVFISWHNKQVTILKGQDARKFVARLAGLEAKEAQLIMAKLTGNFKHGNERAARDD